MRWRSWAMVLLGLGILGLSAGCGGKTTATASGEVTVDDQPLEKGTITFVPDAENTPYVQVDIVKGKYTAQVPPGNALVRISEIVVIGERPMYESPDSPKTPIYAEKLPKRYNEQTELKAEIKPGANKLDWPIKSK
jgi:hypothetical protein